MGYGEVTSSASMTHLVGEGPFLTALRVVGGRKQLPSSWKAPPGRASQLLVQKRRGPCCRWPGLLCEPSQAQSTRNEAAFMFFPIAQMERSRLWKGQGILPALPGTPLLCCLRSGTVGMAPALMRTHVFRQGRTATPVPQGPASSERLMPAARGGTGALALTGLL